MLLEHDGCPVIDVPVRQRHGAQPRDARQARGGSRASKRSCASTSRTALEGRDESRCSCRDAVRSKRRAPRLFLRRQKTFACCAGLTCVLGLLWDSTIRWPV